ncbi:hypothetical protein ABPG72_012132 [Tetrahymena utriculariae]
MKSSSNNIKSLSKEQRILSLYQSGIKDATKIHRLVKRVCNISIRTVYELVYVYHSLLYDQEICLRLEVQAIYLMIALEYLQLKICSQSSCHQEFGKDVIDKITAKAKGQTKVSNKKEENINVGIKKKNIPSKSNRTKANKKQ